MATLRDFVYGRYKRTDDLALSPSWVSFRLQKALLWSMRSHDFYFRVEKYRKRSYKRKVTGNFCDTNQRMNKNRTKYFYAAKGTNRY